MEGGSRSYKNHSTVEPETELPSDYLVSYYPQHSHSCKQVDRNLSIVKLAGNADAVFHKYALDGLQTQALHIMATYLWHGYHICQDWNLQGAGYNAADLEPHKTRRVCCIT